MKLWTLASFRKKQIHCSWGIFNDTYASPRIRKMILEEHSPTRRLSPFIYRSIPLTSHLHSPSYYLSVHAYIFYIRVFFFFFSPFRCCLSSGRLKRKRTSSQSVNCKNSKIIIFAYSLSSCYRLCRLAFCKSK